MERRPVIIVGSGPAGAATAIALHQRDRVLAREVLILEKTRHPRPKVCAGGLIPAGWRWLHEHDVPFDVPHVAVQRARVTTPSRTVEHEEANLCFVVRRNEFDAALVEAARERGTEVREDEPALSLDRDETGVRVTTARGVYHAATVIGADGAGSVVRRTLVNPGRDCLARAVMADVPVESSTWDGVERRRYDFDFRLLRRGIRGYLWAFPCVVDGAPHVNGGAYAVTPGGAVLDEALGEYMDSLGITAARRRAFPIHWFRSGQQVAGDRCWLVGDAAGVDPLMGEGISLALDYGDLAAQALVEGRRSGDVSGAAYQRMFEASWLSGKLRRLAWATALFYGRATWRSCFALAERSRSLRAVGLRWYNGIDGWDRRSGWAAAGAVLAGRAR